MDVEWIIMVEDQGKIYNDYDLYIAVWNVLRKEQEYSKIATECGGQRRMGIYN